MIGLGQVQVEIPQQRQHVELPVDDDTLRQVEEAVRALLPEDEMLVHFDVLIETRCGPDARKIRFRRLSPPGSDPLLSLGLLTATKARLNRLLGLAE